MSGPLYPEPPHLIMAIYPSGTEEECFASLCQIAEDNGCRPEGTVEVAPRDAPFELRSDLAGQTTVVKAKPDRFRTLVSADSDQGRAVRAGFQGRHFSTVVVEYIMAPGGSKHPIEFAMAAGPLGAPEDTWTKSDRSRARNLVRFTTDLLRAATERRCALYGSITVESALPVPYELANGAEMLGTEVFVSNQVLEADSRLPEVLATDFKEVVDWPNGLRCSAWGPFTCSGFDASDTEDPRHFARSSVAVGRAARLRETG